MSSSQARGWRSPPVHENKTVLRRTGGHSSSVRLPPFAQYPSTGHSSVGRVVSLYEGPPPLFSCLRLVRAFTLSTTTSRACNEVHVENGSHRTDIRPTSGRLTLHGDGSGFKIPAFALNACASPPQQRRWLQHHKSLRVARWNATAGWVTVVGTAAAPSGLQPCQAMARRAVGCRNGRRLARRHWLWRPRSLSKT
jgi:hypothetical protein